MKKYKYKKVNAFTSKTSKGNPAAYLLLDEKGLTPSEMLSIGKEHAGFVSEIVFCSPSKVADCKLTYYSSECEVEFCGHGTIATMYNLIESTESLKNKPILKIETNKKGILNVYNDIYSSGSIYISAPAAKHLTTTLSAKEVASSLSLTEEDIDLSHPIEFIDAGLRTLIVPIIKLQTEISVYPSEAELKAFLIANNIDIVLIYCMKTDSPDCFAHTRVFAPKFGYLEDPATGSGNSAFANYLLKNNMWDGSPISIEQGGNNIEYNRVMLKTLGDTVLFGGNATLIIDGEYHQNS